MKAWPKKYAQEELKKIGVSGKVCHMHRLLGSVLSRYQVAYKLLIDYVILIKICHLLKKIKIGKLILK